jgi:hypothetical protein
LDVLKRISALLKQLGTWYFWLSAGIYALVGWLGYALPTLSLVRNYQALNPSLKNLFSVEDCGLKR